MAATIRPVNWRCDSAAIMSFQKEIYETNFPGFRMSVRFLRDYEQQLKAATRTSSERLLVLELEGQVVGFIWLALIVTMVDPLVGYIKNIYVAPELRGRGYARQLLAEADEWFRSHGCPKASLDASICNTRAVHLYLSCGYEPARYRMEKRYEGSPVSFSGGGEER